MMPLGFHTDAFNSSYWSFEQCLEWARDHQVEFIECGAIDGVSWIHGLGYQPHIALWEDPLLLRRKMDKYGVRFSQVDAAFPLSRPEGATLGVEYVLHTIRWAAMTGCPRVDTTDDRHAPEGMTDRQALDYMRSLYQRIIPVAEAYRVTVNIEPHGYYTTKPDFMEDLLDASDSHYLKMNMDTGNTFIAGQDPVAFLKRFLPLVSHVHIKDVSPSLAAAARGELTGIAVSHCAIGEGVNADNIRECLRLLEAYGFSGVLSLECEGQGGPMLERSLEWVRAEMRQLPPHHAGA